MSKKKTLGCILISAVTGVLVGTVITLFKLAAGWISSKSEMIYSFVSQNLIYFPLLLLGLIILAAATYFLLKFCPKAKGLGLPASIGLMRGTLSFNPIKTLITTFASALITFFAGVPLGNEGPSVHMGAAVGNAISKNPAWRRYVMTSGACAGFSAATGAPVSGIFLGLEETHKRFSPMLVFSAATGAIFAKITTLLLGADTSFLPLGEIYSLKAEHLPIAVLVGAAAGLTAMLYSNLYSFFGKITEKIPRTVKIGAVFVLTGAIGVFLPHFIGNGHHLIKELLNGEILIYIAVLILLSKLVMTVFASSAGVTGGLFIPMLTVGALLGFIEGQILIALGFNPEICTPVILISTAAFLSASMKTPLMAITFGIEALCLGSNLLFAVTAVITAYFFTENIQSIGEKSLKLQVQEEREGKTPCHLEFSVTVVKDSFADGRAVRDLLMPNDCVIVETVRTGEKGIVNHGIKILNAGDVLRMHSITYDTEVLKKNLYALFGDENIEFSHIPG